MKNIVPGLLTIVLLNCLNGCYSKKEITAKQKEKLILLRKEIKENLTTNLLPYWSTKMIDTVNGGFYGRVDRGEKVYPDAEKRGILSARLLWTFSLAFRVLGDSSYLHLANRAKYGRINGWKRDCAMCLKYSMIK